MTIEEILNDKTIKAKGKMAQIGDRILNGELSTDELASVAKNQHGANKATCIEALEYATRKRPEVADANLLEFVTASLTDNEPRIKWESAKVIGNIAKKFPNQLTLATDGLVSNAEHSGTVVRWATAYALGEILKLKTEHSKKLLPKIEVLVEKEEDNGVKKKYLDALKKVPK